MQVAMKAVKLWRNVDAEGRKVVLKNIKTPPLKESNKSLSLV
jgi:hypothetical protein